MNARDYVLMEFMDGRPTQGTPELMIIICNMADEIVQLRHANERLLVRHTSVA